MRAHLMGCNGRKMKKCKWGKQRTGQVFFFPWRQGETLNIRPLWNPKISVNLHLGNIPNATVKAAACEKPRKKATCTFPFPTAACCCESNCRSSTAWRQWPAPGADVLANSQMFQESRGAGSAQASSNHCTHPPPHTQLFQDSRVADVSAGEQPHGDGFSAHSWAILINLATEEGAELNMRADCCKLPGSGYKLKKSSEITCKA